MLCCSQSVGGRGRTRHRVANRHPAAVHVDRRTEEENLFVLRRLAQGTSHRCRVLLAEELTRASPMINSSRPVIDAKLEVFGVLKAHALSAFARARKAVPDRPARELQS